MTTSSEIVRRALPHSRVTDPRTSDVVFRVARARIVSGEWAAGRRLDLEAIARELDVSQTPVREAVLRLEADGFVTRLPYKGAVVRGVELGFVEEVFVLRLRLEGMGARLASRWRDDAQVSELRAMLERASREATKHDWDFQADANDRFHLMVVRSSGAAETARVLAPLLRHTERFIMMLHLNIGMREVEHSHQALVDAVEERDPPGAERAIRAHLIELFGQLVSAQNPPGGLRFVPDVLSKSELAQLRGSSSGTRP